jgi:hypothetical protein
MPSNSYNFRRNRFAPIQFIVPPVATPVELATVVHRVHFTAHILK